MKRTATDPETNYYELMRSIATLGKAKAPEGTPRIHDVLMKLASGDRTSISSDSTSLIRRKANNFDQIEALVEGGHIGLLELAPLIVPPAKFVAKHGFEKIPNLTQEQRKAVLYAVLVAAKDILETAVTYFNALGVNGANTRYASIARNVEKELREIKEGLAKSDVTVLSGEQK